MDQKLKRYLSGRMTSFDPDVLRERALHRYLKSTHKPCSEKRYLDDVSSIYSLQMLQKWATKKGLKFEFMRMPNAAYDSKRKTIEISSALSMKKCLHMVLHELGHYLLDAAGDRDLKYSMGWPSAGDNTIKRTVHHRIDLLAEEFDAWAKGWSLAERLRLIVDQREFNETKVTCLKSYVYWVARANGFKGPIVAPGDLEDVEEKEPSEEPS